MAEKVAVYPGTFDPMTRGHFDLITRAAGLYDRLVVAVAATSVKSGALFDAQHRIDMIREDVEKAELANVEVDILDTLLVDFCRKIGARVVIRGVRVYSDFEYEFQMALTNRRMAPEIETLFMMPSENLAYVSPPCSGGSSRGHDHGGSVDHRRGPVGSGRRGGRGRT